MLEIAVIAISIVANICIGVAAYVKDPRSLSNRVFAGLAAALIFWPTVNYLSLHEASHALLYIRLVMCGVALMNLAFYGLAYIYPHRTFHFGKAQKWLIGYGVFVAFLTLTPAVFSGIQFNADGSPSPTPAPGILLFIIDIGILVGGGTLHLIKRRKTAATLERAQITLMLIGAILMYSLAVFTNFVLAVAFNFPLAAAFGPLWTILFSASIGYAMIRHHLFDIRRVVARSVSYTVLVVFLAGIYVLAAYGLSSLFLTNGQADTAQLILNCALALLLAITFQPLRRLFEHVTDRVFYQDRYDSQAVLSGLSSVLVSEAELNSLGQSVIGQLRSALKITAGELYVMREKTLKLQVSQGYSQNHTLLTTYFDQLKAASIFSDNLEPGVERDQLVDAGVHAAIELRSDKNSVGYLVLGEKLSGGPYTMQDQELLQIFAQELAVAVSNATAFEDIANFNRTLQEKIDSATKDLRTTNQSLLGNNMELAESNKTLQLLRKIDESVLSPESGMGHSLQRMTTILAEDSGFPFAAIYLRGARQGVLHPEAISSRIGTPAAQKAVEAAMIQHPILMRHSTNPIVHAVSGMLIVTADNLFDVVHPYLPIEEAEELQEGLRLKTFFICPLQARGEVLGAMVLATPETQEQMSFYEKSLIERLTVSVGIALDNTMLYAKAAEAARRLRTANRHLKELDRAKDEFISMASHQLRTPLTSIKGYLSMILEGDTGTINADQKEFLGYAYTSSQRMVSLIADLLNVSRMSAGKFVINPSAVDLVAVAQEEVQQLQQTASGKGLFLKFVAPQHKIPILQLDEDKTRQVIMNFIDNALYYTKAGGVTVSVEKVRNKVEVRVSDTGIGVPKEAQKRLFSKFFRAGNAQTMRPDGSGLGLFLAKRVVEDQDGTIIFETIENKGSTFGFSFPLIKESHGTHK